MRLNISICNLLNDRNGRNAKLGYTLKYQLLELKLRLQREEEFNKYANIHDRSIVPPPLPWESIKCVPISNVEHPKDDDDNDRDRDYYCFYGIAIMNVSSIVVERQPAHQHQESPTKESNRFTPKNLLKNYCHFNRRSK